MPYALLCICCIVLAALFSKKKYTGDFKHSAVYKALASLCFVLCGLTAAMPLSGNSLAAQVLSRLILGFFADILLSLRYMRKKHWKKYFVAGTVVFLAGHIAYLLPLLRLVSSPLPCIASAMVLTVFVCVFLYRRTLVKRLLQLLGALYILVISLMACTAWGAAFSSPGRFTLLFALGASSFLASDVLLILNNFGPGGRFSRKVISTYLYYIGQLLIALSLLA